MSFRVLAVSLMLLGFAPSVAHADGLIVPFYGVNFGGTSGENISTAFDANRNTWGVSFAWMGAGVIGLEADLGYTSDFYGKTDADGTGLLSATGNVLLGLPFGGQKGFGIRPYGLIGLGLIHSKLDALTDVIGFDDTQASWDVGGGVMMFFTSHVGVRGDLRYIRTFSAVDFLGLTESDHIEFSRGTVGLVLRF